MIGNIHSGGTIVAAAITAILCSTTIAATVYYPSSYFNGCTGRGCHDTNPHPDGLWVNVPADEDNDGNPNPDDGSTRDPINVITGCVTDRADDLRLPGAVFPLSFSRFYVSSRGWRHSFDTRLEFSGADLPRISMPDGQILPFSAETGTTGEWRTYRDVDWTLIRSSSGYVLEMDDGAHVDFTLDGRMTRMTNPSGNVLLLTYTGDNLSSVSRNGTVAFSLSYSNGHLVRVDTPDASYFVQYEYSAEGDLVSSSVNIGTSVSTTQYTYGPYGLTSRTNAAGDVSWYAYCEDIGSAYQGRATYLVHGDGFYEHEIEYLPTVWNGASGSRVTYMRDGEPIVHEYACSSDASRVTAMRIMGCGLSGAASNSVVRTYGYDKNFRKTSEWTYETSIADDVSKTAVETYARAYNLKSVSAYGSDTYSFNGATVMNTYAWDAGFRHITAVNNAFGGETRISYSTTGMPTATWQGCGAAESARTTYDYNGMGLLTRETNPRGGNRIVMRRSDGLPVSETSANGMTIYYEYDSLGHLVAATRCGIELFRNTVDADGRITRTDYPDGTFETVEYDAMRRPVVLVDRAGRTEVLAYSAGSTVTNASLTCAMPGGALATTSIGMRHDTQLNIREVRNEGSVAVESYALDACDRVVAVTNAEGQVARMEYVLGDRISRTRRFDGSEVSYEWNAYGLKQAAYQSFTNNYLRMMDGSLSRASGPNGVIAYKYDKFGNTTNVVTEQGCVAQAFDSTGDIVRKTWSDGEVAYSYDRAGRVTNMVWTVAGLTLPFSCSYSPTNGALSSVEYPNGVFSERGYDVMDRIAKIGWRGYASSGSDTREYEYDNADNIVSISTASGEIINYAYDGRDRLVGESRSGESVAYIYDATGNRIGKSVNGNGAAEEYASNYLAGDRLAEWSRTDADIAVDAVTNATYSYAASGCTTNVLEHCANGSTREVSYAWTDDYRLSSVSVNGAEVAEYAYDALGNLISVANGGESFEILVENGHALADVTEDGSTLRVYMKAPGIDKWLGFVDMTGSSPVPYFYVTDHLGSVLAVTDANGNLVERYTYDAWGKVLSVTDANGNALTRSAIGNRILWQGREYSWTTGLYYFRNRWYDPEISRWISRDMIGINGGLNLYAYCGNSPVVRADPNGKFWVQVCVAVGITYLVYSFVDYILTINRTMESADVNDIRDISKALDCCTETAIRITPIFGPPTPDPTLPITDKTTDLIMRPIWKRIFDRVRPTTRKKCK